MLESPPLWLDPCHASGLNVLVLTRRDEQVDASTGLLSVYLVGCGRDAGGDEPVTVLPLSRARDASALAMPL